MFFYLKLRGEKCGANEEMFVLLKVLRTVDSLSPPHTPLLILVFLFEVQDEVRDYLLLTICCAFMAYAQKESMTKLPLSHEDTANGKKCPSRLT